MAKNLTVQDLSERLELAKKSRGQFETDWMANIAYISGVQDVGFTFDPVTRMISQDVEGPVAIHNVIQKIARTEQTKLLRTSPVPVALPVTDSDRDIYDAKVVSAYFRHLQEEFHYERKLRQAAYWLVAAGNVFFKWYWASGAPRMSIVTPFDIYPDPYARTFDACRWAIYEQFMDEDSAKEIYKLDDAKLGQMRHNGSFDLTSVEARTFSNYGSTDGGTLPGVLVREYWEAPSASCPKGRFVVFTDNQIIYESAFPYAHGQLPFTHAGHIERAGNKWSASVLDQARFLQDELNRVERQMIENRNISNGIWFIPAEVELETEITSEPRQVIKWTGPPGLDPRTWMVTPSSLPAWVAGEPARIKDTMQDVVHQHEVSNAGVPGRVESGQAIQLLQETDDSVMKQVIHSLEEAVSDGFLQCAQLYRQYGTDDAIMLSVYDKDNTVQVKRFARDMVPLNLRVKAATTTGLPRTIAGKWDRVLNMVQYQLIPPDYALQLLEISPEDPELKPDALDQRNADAENLELLAGKPVLARKYDSHMVHMERHDRFRKSAEYKLAVAEDPAVEERFEAHHISHLEELQKWAQEQQTIQAAIAQPPPGAPAGEGEPPPGAAPPAPAPNGGPAPVA